MIDTAYERGDYDWLYANYLTAAHGRLEDAVRASCAFGHPEVAVDLCAGTGALTQVLLDEHIEHVIAVDGSRAMLGRLRAKITPLNRVHSNVTTIRTDLNHEHALLSVAEEIPGRRADLITCRQGIGYLDPHVLSHVPSLLRPGGRFLFNSFAEPSHMPWWKRRSGGIREAGVYVFGRVVHLQARWPRFDVTTFRWHDIEGTFARGWETLGYKVRVAQHNRTLIVEVAKP
jgi:SAM-dependent methyltransferase